MVGSYVSTKWFRQSCDTHGQSARFSSGLESTNLNCECGFANTAVSKHHQLVQCHLSVRHGYDVVLLTQQGGDFQVLAARWLCAVRRRPGRRATAEVPTQARTPAAAPRAHTVFRAATADAL